MIIYYKNKLPNVKNLNVDKFCQIRKDFFARAWSKAKIYLLKINGIPYISKTYDKSGDSYEEFKKEISQFVLVKIQSKDNIIFQNFFIHYHLIADCGNTYHIIMKKIHYNLDIQFLQNISTLEKNNLLTQALIVIFDMNHNCGIFFNDIYYRENLRNIMVSVNSSNFNKKIEYHFVIEGGNYSSRIMIPIKKYQIKVIDYGRIDTQPNFRTTEYMEKYFNHLYNIGIISEPLLFSFFFMLNCGLKKDYVTMILNTIIKFILDHNLIKNNNKYNQKHFDALFIQYLIKYISLKDNFYNRAK